jgi:hypothetical protein
VVRVPQLDRGAGAIVRGGLAVAHGRDAVLGGARAVVHRAGAEGGQVALRVPVHAGAQARGFERLGGAIAFVRRHIAVACHEVALMGRAEPVRRRPRAFDRRLEPLVRRLAAPRARGPGLVRLHGLLAIGHGLFEV